MGLRTEKVRCTAKWAPANSPRFQPDNAGMDDSGMCASGVAHLVHVRHANGRVEAPPGRVARARCAGSCAPRLVCYHPEYITSWRSSYLLTIVRYCSVLYLLTYVVVNY